MDTPTRIVLIDDNLPWREVLSEFLQRKGFQVLSARSPLEGLLLLDNQDVALIVCDYHMPGMNGLQLLHRIKEHPRKAAVLMVSSEQEPSVAARARAAGARDFLDKAIAPGVLLDRVRQIIEGTRMPSTAAPILRSWQRLLPGPRQPTRRLASARFRAPASRSEPRQWHANGLA